LPSPSQHVEPRSSAGDDDQRHEKYRHFYDGIVLGAPALDFNNLVSWRASFFPITGSVNSTDFITESQWKGLIHEEVLRQCDCIDGVEDGIIEDPDLCHFEPEKLLCPDDGTKKGDCLTAAQVDIVRKVFQPLINASGDVLFPAMQPGSEVLAAERLYAGKPFSYSEVRPPFPFNFQHLPLKSITQSTLYSFYTANLTTIFRIGSNT
jgi:hypothetical protein